MHFRTDAQYRQRNAGGQRTWDGRRERGRGEDSQNIIFRECDGRVGKTRAGGVWTVLGWYNPGSILLLPHLCLHRLLRFVMRVQHATRPIGGGSRRFPFQPLSGGRAIASSCAYARGATHPPHRLRASWIVANSCCVRSFNKYSIHGVFLHIVTYFSTLSASFASVAR